MFVACSLVLNSLIKGVKPHTLQLYNYSATWQAFSLVFSAFEVKTREVHHLVHMRRHQILIFQWRFAPQKTQTTSKTKGAGAAHYKPPTNRSPRLQNSSTRVSSSIVRPSWRSWTHLDAWNVRPCLKGIQMKFLFSKSTFPPSDSFTHFCQDAERVGQKTSLVKTCCAWSWSSVPLPSWSIWAWLGEPQEMDKSINNFSIDCCIKRNKHREQQKCNKTMDGLSLIPSYYWSCYNIEMNTYEYSVNYQYLHKCSNLMTNYQGIPLNDLAKHCKTLYHTVYNIWNIWPNSNTNWITSVCIRVRHMNMDIHEANTNSIQTIAKDLFPFKQNQANQNEIKKQQNPWNDSNNKMNQ